MAVLPNKEAEEKAAQMIASAALVSNSIREALQSSLPVATNQLMTIQVPGVVIDCDKHGPYWWDPKEHSETPHRVKVNEARLVDSMVPLSKLMMGPTGKSVSRSYAAALDMLIPEDAPIDTDTSTQSKSQAAERYGAAMKYLTSKAPDSARTVVDVYVEKQQAWTDSMKLWDAAKQAAHEEARRQFPDNVKQQQWHYDEWNQANFRNFKNHAQAKYMDWIVNGCKYKVDYYFGIVDVSSAMKRVESSKEASRNLVVIDPDGTTEWQEVNLNPANWANLCLEKVQQWNENNSKLSRKDYESEIKRMRRLLLSYQGLLESLGGKLTQAEREALGQDGAAASTTSNETGEDAALTAAYKELYDAQAPATPDPTKLKAAQDGLQAALDKQGKANLKLNKTNVEAMVRASGGKKRLWVEKMIEDTEEQLVLLNRGLEGMTKANVAVPAVQDLSLQESKEAGEMVKVNYSESDAQWADARFGLTRNNEALTSAAQVKKEPSKWTKISISISASSAASSNSSQSSSTSVSASGSWGLFSASGGFNYSQASADASSSAASCNVEISFEALLVTIDRAWLHGELFADPELNTSHDVALSPGESLLQEYISKKDTSSLQKYGYFPSYPTAFIVASNVELEFRGDTTHLEEAIESSSFDANLKVGYGPFSLGASHKQEKKSAKTKMETTAAGTRISLEAPAIIGWVSTLLPELPRRRGGNSLVQPFF